MPDGRDHRNRTRHDGPRDTLVVERPQVFLATTTSSDDHQVCARPARYPPERRSNFQRGSISLYFRLANNELHARIRLSHDRNDVTERRAIRAGDDRDALRESGDRSLPAFVQQSFFAKLRQRQLHRLSPETIANGFDANYSQLQVAARGKHSHLAVQHDLHPDVRRGGNSPPIAGPADALDFCRGVAQAEIPVTVAMVLEVADLAAHPHRLQ